MSSIGTGNSLSETLIFVSINPQYDNRLYMELRVQYVHGNYKCRTWAEHVMQTFCPCSTLVFSCTELVIP